MKLFDGDATVDTRSPAIRFRRRRAMDRRTDRGGRRRAMDRRLVVSPSRVLLSPIGKNRVEPTNVVDVRRNDRERRKKEKKEKKDREKDRERDRGTRRQPRDFGGGGAAATATATGADLRIYESTPEPVRQPAPRPEPTIFGGGHPALGGGGTIPAKRDWYREPRGGGHAGG